MPQACGERIITPSSTACPPTRVSSPLSRAGSNWIAARKRKICRKRMRVRCSFGEGRLRLLAYHSDCRSQKSDCRSEQKPLLSADLQEIGNRHFARIPCLPFPLSFSPAFLLLQSDFCLLQFRACAITSESHAALRPDLRRYRRNQ